MIEQILTLIFIAIFIGLSQTAGIGGGPIINVLLMFRDYYFGDIEGQGHDKVSNSQRTISITYLFLIGGSIASIWKNSTKKNPETNLIYLNVDLILITLPMMNVGSIIGSVFKSFLSEFVITVLFGGVFGLLVRQILGNLRSIRNVDARDKGRQRNKENENNLKNNKSKKNNQFTQIQNNSTQRNQITKPIPTKHRRKLSNKAKVIPSAQDTQPKQTHTKYNKTLSSQTQPQEIPHPIQPLQSPQKSHPIQPTQKTKQNKKALYLILESVIFYILAILLSLIRGGINYQSIIGLESCSFVSFGIFIGYFGVCLYVTKVIVRLVREGRINGVYTSRVGINDERYNNSGEDWIQNHKDKDKKIQQFQLQTQSIQLPKQQIKNIHQIPIDESSIKSYIVAGFSAGLLGATLGIGGAPILIPIWLNLGIHHNVAANSTAALILNSALISTTISYLNSSYTQIPYTQILLYLVLAFISSAVIKDIMNYFAEKYQLKYMVVVLLLVIVGVSIAVMVPMQVGKYFGDREGFVQFGDFC